MFGEYSHEELGNVPDVDDGEEIDSTIGPCRFRHTPGDPSRFIIVGNSKEAQAMYEKLAELMGLHAHPRDPNVNLQNAWDEFLASFREIAPVRYVEKTKNQLIRVFCKHREGNATASVGVNVDSYDDSWSFNQILYYRLLNHRD